MRTHVKETVERLLAPLGRMRVRAPWAGAQRIVLAYHNIVPDDWTVQGDRSLHVPVSRFETHLDCLMELVDVRPLRELINRNKEPQRRPRVAITFDDAYSGTLTLGLKELARRGLDATVFVSPARLGETFWWDILAASLGPAYSADLRLRALTEFAGDQDSILRALAPSNRTVSLPSFVRAATADQIRLTAEQPGITVAAHGWSHRNMVCLTEEELETELVRPLRWLSDHLPNVAPYLAYPYGFHSPLVEDMSRRAGYVASFRIDGGGWREPERRTFSLPRLNVPRDLSQRGLILRLGGLL